MKGEKIMLFVSVHCEDEIDRAHYIPLHEVQEVKLNADGGDCIIAHDRVYLPRIQDNFFMSVVEVGAWVDEYE